MNKGSKTLISLSLISIMLFSSCSLNEGIEVISLITEKVEETIVKAFGRDKDFVEGKMLISSSDENKAQLPTEFLSLREKMLPFDKRYGYNSLNDTEKELYRRISDSVVKLSSTVDVLDLDLSGERISAVFYAFLNDSPEIFYLSDRHTVLCWFSDKTAVLMLYYMDGEAIDAYDEAYAALTAEANRAEISVQAGLLSKKANEIISFENLQSEKEKVRFVHDFVATQTVYDTEYADILKDLPNEKLQSTSYGCLVEKNAVCSGITEGASLLLSLLGVENTVCYGKSEEMYHEWNIVLIDENYYHMDITWDVSLEAGNSRWVGYEFYLLSDIQISSSRTVIWEGNPDEKFMSFPKPDCSDDSLYIFDDIMSSNKTSVSIASSMKAAAENKVRYVIINAGVNLSTERLDKIATDIYYSSAANIASGFCGKRISMGDTYYLIDSSRIYQSLVY